MTLTAGAALVAPPPTNRPSLIAPPCTRAALFFARVVFMPLCESLLITL